MRPAVASLLAGLTAAGSLGIAAVPAQAAVVKRLRLQCEYPLVGVLPIKMELTAAIPAASPAGSETPAVLIAGTLTAGSAEDGTSTWDGMKVLRAASLRGVATTAMTVNGGGIDNLPVDADLTIASYVVPPIEQDLVLSAAGATPPLTFPSPGRVDLTIDGFRLNLRAFKADGTPLRLPPIADDSDGDPDTFDVSCTFEPGQDLKFSEPSIGLSDPPTPPGAPVYDFRSGLLTWTRATDDFSVNGYDVLLNEQLVGTTDGRTTSYVVPQATLRNGANTFQVRARDADGNVTAGPVSPFEVTPAMGPPPPPGPPEATGITTTAAFLTWRPSIPAVGATIDRYEIFVDGRLLANTRETSLELTDLTPNTRYCHTIVAVLESGGRSLPSDESCFTTPPRVIIDDFGYRYAIAGSATLKTLTKGALPIRGSLDAQVLLNTGAVGADLKLEPTKARLTALGFIPVTASVAFVTSGKTTGTLNDDGLKTTSNVRIKVPQVSLFGTIPLAGGTTCQTRQLSKITLTSADFDLFDGGALKGTFAISDLSGCGALNGLVSPLTAGGGNTISITLTPRR